mmetsp:Transcript_2212/g.3780  ORF Transcript_2212/g.3780 Transcript_2212/m.3780 type:complete len:253 (+) Transcript_2212:46-804(+)
MSSAPWCDPYVVQLANKTVQPGDCCGLVVICSWPMPSAVVESYVQFKTRLSEVMPSEAYIYPAEALHITVATLRSFHGPHLDAAAQENRRMVWTPVLAAARAMPSWPTSSFRVKMMKPTFEGSAVIFRYADVDGAVESMRKCIIQAISDAGGVAAIGGGDRSQGRPPLGGAADDPPPHVPNILHSTALRWAAEPTDRDAAKAAFASVADTWEPVEVHVQGARAVFEDAPYMHIPEDASHVWWESDAVPAQKL